MRKNRWLRECERKIVVRVCLAAVDARATMMMDVLAHKRVAAPTQRSSVEYTPGLLQNVAI
jgi:hypothetical protein